MPTNSTKRHQIVFQTMSSYSTKVECIHDVPHNHMATEHVMSVAQYPSKLRTFTNCAHINYYPPKLTTRPAESTHLEGNDVAHPLATSMVGRSMSALALVRLRGIAVAHLKKVGTIVVGGRTLQKGIEKEMRVTQRLHVFLTKCVRAPKSPRGRIQYRISCRGVE